MTYLTSEYCFRSERMNDKSANSTLFRRSMMGWDFFDFKTGANFMSQRSSATVTVGK